MPATVHLTSQARKVRHEVLTWLARPAYCLPHRNLTSQAGEAGSVDQNLENSIVTTRDPGRSVSPIGPEARDLGDCPRVSAVDLSSRKTCPLAMAQPRIAGRFAPILLDHPGARPMA